MPFEALPVPAATCLQIEHIHAVPSIATVDPQPEEGPRLPALIRQALDCNALKADLLDVVAGAPYEFSVMGEDHEGFFHLPRLAAAAQNLQKAKVPPFGRHLQPFALEPVEPDDDEMRRQRALRLRALNLEPPGRRAIQKFAERERLQVQSRAPTEGLNELCPVSGRLCVSNLRRSELKGLQQQARDWRAQPDEDSHAGRSGSLTSRNLKTPSSFWPRTAQPGLCRFALSADVGALLPGELVGDEPLDIEVDLVLDGKVFCTGQSSKAVFDTPERGKFKAQQFIFAIKVRDLPLESHLHFRWRDASTVLRSGVLPLFNDRGVLRQGAQSENCMDSNQAAVFERLPIKNGLSHPHCVILAAIRLHDFQIDFLAAMAAPPFLFDLSITGMPGSYQLYISERALRFTDREEQNMKIIPRNMVSSITIRRLASDGVAVVVTVRMCACICLSKRKQQVLVGFGVSKIDTSRNLVGILSLDRTQHYSSHIDISHVIRDLPTPFDPGDTDLSFSTTDMPKALSCTGLTAAVSAWLARRSMYGLVHSKGGLDLCSLVGAGFGVWAGWKVGHAVFRKQHIVDGSFVQLHTSGGVTGFNCSDLKAQELVRLLLALTTPKLFEATGAPGAGHAARELEEVSDGMGIQMFPKCRGAQWRGLVLLTKDGSPGSIECNFLYCNRAVFAFALDFTAGQAGVWQSASRGWEMPRPPMGQELADGFEHGLGVISGRCESLSLALASAPATGAAKAFCHRAVAAVELHRRQHSAGGFQPVL
eukprot:s682_g13.t1